MQYEMQSDDASKEISDEDEGYCRISQTNIILQVRQSNAELTLKSIESVNEPSADNREAYGRLFGQMKLSFSEDGVVIVDTGIAGTEKYSTHFRIVSSGPNHISIEFGDPGDPLDFAEYFYDGLCMKRKFEVGETLKGSFEYWCRVD